MPSLAIVVKVMIASPSDVEEERSIVRESIHEWNAIHAEERSVWLSPVGADTHASPSMASEAQDVINRQVLEGCDLLVGIFWRRLGTPTATDPSGAAEEIRRHVEACGEAMIYFSDRDASPSTHDPAQYESLQAFREACQSMGYVEAFSTTEEFRRKFSRQLAQAIQRLVPANALADKVGQAVQLLLSGSIDSAQPSSLSNEARILLSEGAQDEQGRLMKLSAAGGTWILANKNRWPEDSSARSIAKWVGALEELEREGLVTTENGKAYHLTSAAFELADTLSLPEQSTDGE